MTTAEIQRLIDSGNELAFYAGTEWKRLADKVRRYDNRECQLCKQDGRYRRGSIVHHIKHLRDRPDLAFTIYDPDTKERQLITVCKQCHEKLHPEALPAPKISEKKYETPERWD